MFKALADWIFNRALRLSASAVKSLARLTRLNPSRIQAVNDAVAGIVASQAVQAAQEALAGTDTPGSAGS